MFISRNFARTLKVVASGLAIFATVPFQASGQQTENVRFYGNIDYKYAEDELGQGMEANRRGKLDEAIRHFQEAVVLDPTRYDAKEHLADALTQKVLPGVETPKNLKTAQQAISLYQEVMLTPGLSISSFSTVYMTKIARINFSINKLEESKSWRKRVLDVEPKDAEASFAVGVIDWMQAHQNALTALKAAGLADDGMGNAKVPAIVMESIKTQNAALVDEALLYLNQAVENRPNYDDAMHYLDLVYRSNADLDYGNEAARLDDLVKADEWGRKAMETRKANEAKKLAGAGAAKL